MFFYPFTTIFVVEFRNCKKYQQSSQILEMLPKSEMQFQIRKRYEFQNLSSRLMLCNLTTELRSIAFLIFSIFAFW